MYHDYNDWIKMLFWDFPNNTYNRNQGSQTLEEEIGKGKIHPESNSLKNRNFCGMVTINFFPYSFTADTPMAEARRKKFTYAFMSEIRELLGSRNKLCWVANHEFGMDANGHIHLLLSFDDVQDPTKIPEMTDFATLGQQAVKSTCERKDSELDSHDVDFHWLPKWKERIEGSLKSANDGLVSYFCKKENYRSEKSFFYDPKRLIHKLNEQDSADGAAT